MHGNSILFTMFVIFSGAALLATAALYARQSLLVVYVALGILVGPVLGWVYDTYMVRQVADIGILFLLFLLGLNLPPAKLQQMVRESAKVALYSTILFVVTGGIIAGLFGYNVLESTLIGICLVFSSTIIGLKLLPTTVLHHQRTGGIIISILLLQDIVAILVLESLQVLGHGEGGWWKLIVTMLAFPALYAIAYMLERLVMVRLMRRFDKIQEYVFLLAIGWCLAIAELGNRMGLLPEIGAFIAGVALANNPISLFIADRLRPLRDFFLIMFFFTIGASFQPGIIGDVFFPALILGLLTLVVKPWIYNVLLKKAEGEQRALEVGVRLGQSSEFSLLIAVLATDLGVIGTDAASLIQLATLMTFLVSPYLIVLRYPTPVALSDKLRRD
ncbi:MAG TPA: cation:proton antiporter [Mariprofundaceae bacterium]|nr:cation:proton antiporter [Mariprofundaceae bacterium]